MNVICMIVQSLYPYDPRVRRESEVLARAGYGVDIICLRGNDQEKIEIFGSITVYRILKEKKDESILRYMAISFCFFILSLIKLHVLLIKRRYKVIQFHNMPDHLVFVGILPKIMGIPIIIDMHDLTLELFSAKWPGRKYSFLFQIIKIVEQLSCKFADHIITVCDTCKELLIQRGNPQKKITLVLNTPDLNIFVFNKDRKFDIIKRNVKIIYHGTVAARFGLHILIEAMAIVQNNISGSILSIYGNYDLNYRNILVEKIKQLNLENHVSLHGVCSLEEIYSIINQYDIGIVPYINNNYMHLALSTKAFEYAASGLPIIASRLTSLALIFDNKSIYFCEPENVQDLAEKIIGLCLNPKKRAIQSKKAAEIVHSISWEIMANRYLNLIDNFSNSKSKNDY
jgi:glycosyltransferase involved in cell wall biosynthesis